MFTSAYKEIIWCKYAMADPCGRTMQGVGLAAAQLLRFWVRSPPGAWKFFCCECCMFSGWGLCNKLITRPEKSY